MVHKSQAELKTQLSKAAKQVTVGATYAHYKSASMRYKVLDLAIDTDTNEVCVIYKALYGEQLVFVRSLKEWLDDVNGQSGTVKRFTLLSK